MSGSIRQTLGESSRDVGKSRTMAPTSQFAASQVRQPGIQVIRRNDAPSIPINPTITKHNERTLMPVNIKQIHDSWGTRRLNKLFINSTEVSSLKVIGQVYNKEYDEYKGSFKIVDCTGELNASLWFTVGRSELDCIPEGGYAMAVGRVQPDGSGPEMQCYRCRPITNFNDITHHHLSVIATHIDLEFHPPMSVYDGVAGMWRHDMLRSRKKRRIDPTGNHGRPNSQTQGPSTDLSPKVNKDANESGEDNRSKSRELVADCIIELLKAEASNYGQEGVHIDVICEKLTKSKEDVRSSMDLLASEGEVYTTVDSDHFAKS